MARIDGIERVASANLAQHMSAGQTDQEAHDAWLVLMMTAPEQAALAAHHLRAQLKAANERNARLVKAVAAADEMRIRLLDELNGQKSPSLADQARAEVEQ